MKRSLLIVVVCVLSSAPPVISTAVADEGRPERRGPFGAMGPGGAFGGAMSAPLGNPMGLLRMSQIRKELKLSDEQIEAVEKLQTRLRPEFDRPDFRNMSPEERRKFFTDMRTKRDEKQAEVTEQIEDVLLPGQYDRLQQIMLQNQGSAALMRPEIREQLDLTKQQIDQINQAQQKTRQEMGEKMREIFKEGSFEDSQDQVKDMRDQATKRVLDVLTATQRKKFKSLQGKPFEINHSDPDDVPDFRGTTGPRPRFRGGQ